jgi:hypothetical protein
MKAHWAKILILFSYLMTSLMLYAQEDTSNTSAEALPELFRKDFPLNIRLRYSNKFLKRDTNDSTYLQSVIWFSEGDTWDSLPADLRARGNFRRKTCYFAPLKIRIKRSKSTSTPFQGSEKLKMVLPCQLDRYTGDYVLREYLAYKIFERVAPFHFKTRLAEVTLIEDKGRREVTHEFFGFFIEDMDYLSKRYEGHEVKRLIHPLQQDDLASAQNDLFEFMIANTDFSTTQQHNQKLLFVKKRIIPLPYDFDMSGLVNAPYAAVTNIQNLEGSITQVTDRIYKGYERDTALLQRVRLDFLQKRPEILSELEAIESFFQDPLQYREAYEFLESFFGIIEDDKKFERQVLNRLRTR